MKISLYTSISMLTNSPSIRYATWTLDLFHTHKTIAVTPDYRLLPESTGLDILQDAADFYTWLFTPGNLSAYLPNNIHPDLDHILVTGESAGGWHAVQAGLLHPSRIAAIISHYPMIDLRSSHFSGAPPPEGKQVFNPPRPQLDSAILHSYIAKLRGDEIVPFRIPPEGEAHAVVMIQQGLYGELFGTDEKLYALEMLDRMSTFPPTWILHGVEDSVVPVEGTRLFVEKMREKFPGVPLHVTYREGADHGFDLRDDDEKEWREQGVEFVERFWPVK